MKRNKEKKDMEYEEAPSGYVTLYNYKEPFMRFEKGFGYLGVLLFDGESDKVQCHYCGQWYEQLGHHIHNHHGITASEYKAEVGLLQTTALIGEKFRAKLIASALDKRMANLRPGRAKTEAEKEKIRATLKLNAIELKNQRGTCPEQLIDRLKKKTIELGRTPTRREIPGLYQTILRTFPSWEKACMLADVRYRPPSETTGERNVIRYSDEELLTKIADFISINGREPSYSDCRRNLIPPIHCYINHFGGMKNAIEQAKLLAKKI